MDEQGSNAGQVRRAIHAFADNFLGPETFRGMDTWARMASNALRRQCPSKEAKVTIAGRAIQASDGPLAHVECVSLIGFWMEYGTGIHGPEGKPIVAKGGSYVAATGGRRTRAMLRWKSRDGRYVYAASVQGMAPSPWFWPTIEAMLPLVREHIAAAVQRAILRAFVGVAGARLLSAPSPAMPALPPVRLNLVAKARKVRERGVAKMKAKFKRKMAAIHRRAARGR